MNYLQTSTCALAVIDIGLPDISGFEICKKIRSFSKIPVIFLTARNDEIDRVVGLEIGADDYVTKPFSPRELIARIKAVLRRSTTETAPVEQTSISVEPENDMEKTPHYNKLFSIDTGAMRIKYCGTPVLLSRYEFRILEALIKHPRKVFSREELGAISSDEPGFSLERTIDAHIKSIRSKLKVIKNDFDPIETRRGFGYALKENL